MMKVKSKLSLVKVTLIFALSTLGCSKSEHQISQSNSEGLKPSIADEAFSPNRDFFLDLEFSEFQDRPFVLIIRSRDKQYDLATQLRLKKTYVDLSKAFLSKDQLSQFAESLRKAPEWNSICIKENLDVPAKELYPNVGPTISIDELVTDALKDRQSAVESNSFLPRVIFLKKRGSEKFLVEILLPNSSIELDQSGVNDLLSMCAAAPSRFDDYIAREHSKEKTLAENAALNEAKAAADKAKANDFLK